MAKNKIWEVVQGKNVDLDIWQSVFGLRILQSGLKKFKFEAVNQKPQVDRYWSGFLSTMFF